MVQETLTGNVKQLTETVRGTKKEAERVLREHLAAIEKGSYVPKHKETLAEFMERWMDRQTKVKRLLDIILDIGRDPATEKRRQKCYLGRRGYALIMRP